MSKFIGFLFNPVTISEKLKPKWVTIIDHEHLQAKMIEPILNNIHLSENLLQELISLAEHGQNIISKDGVKKITQPEPFSLTPCKVKQVFTASKEDVLKTKAQFIPKGLFETNKVKEKLDEIKKENKLKTLKEYEEAQKKLFRAAKHKPLVVDQIRQQVLNEERQRMAKAPVRSAPQFHPVQVKLTTAAILKRELLLKERKMVQAKKLDDFSIGIRDVTEYEEWQEQTSLKEKIEKQLKVEQKILEVKLLHEEAFEAKQELMRQNKDKALEVSKEKQEIVAINEQKLKELQKVNKKKVELVHEIKHEMKNAMKKIYIEKSKNASEIANQSKKLQKQLEMKKMQEIKEKQDLIQQIKNIEKQPKEKDIDFTESSNLGLLGEMSLVELRERVHQAKAREQIKINERRELLNKQKQKKQKELLEKLRQIEYSTKPIARKPKSNTQIVKFESPEIIKLQQKVMEKRQGNIND